MSVVLRAGALFFLNAFLLGSFLSRVPDVLTRLETDKAMLGLALFAAPVGSVCAALFVGRLIDARTPGHVAIGSGIGLAAGIALVGQSFSVTSLGLFLFVAGIINGIMEVSMNAAADRVEKQTGAKIVARCHGFWSIGFMSGALVAGGAAQAAISDTLHLTVVAVAAAIGVLAVSRIYPASAFVHVPHDPGEKAPAFALPNRYTIGLCLMGVGVTLAEGAIYDWGSLYLRVDIGAPPLTASIAFACFTLAMAVGRFSGDMVRERVAAPTIVRSCAILSGVGLVAFLLSPNPVLAGVALILMGLGVSLVFPIAVTAVSTRGGGGSPAANIAALSLSVMVALLTGPPLIGVIGEAFGLAVAFAVTLPAIAMTFAFAGQSATPHPVSVETVEASPVRDRMRAG